MPVEKAGRINEAKIIHEKGKVDAHVASRKNQTLHFSEKSFVKRKTSKKNRHFVFTSWK